LAELREAGLADQYKQPMDLPDIHFKLLVLLATQIRSFAENATGSGWTSKTRRNTIPIRDELRNEPDPLKAGRKSTAEQKRMKREWHMIARKREGHKKYPSSIG